MTDQQFERLIAALEQIAQSQRDLIAALADSAEEDIEDPQPQYDLAGRLL